MSTIKTQPVSSRWLRISAWFSFILNTLIIATGGAVRLTGSGLGCPTWPLCTADSLVPTAELSYHSLIEFGNRTISGPLLVFGILVVLFSFRVKPVRKDLRTLAVLVLVLVVSQALLGGVLVWLHLNANLVSVHYIISLVIVCLTAAYLVRMYEPNGTRELAVSKLFFMLTHITTVFVAVTVLIGVLTTAAGPHSGDANIQRDGFDATLLSHIHAWPGYITLALVILLTVWAVRKKIQPAKWLATLLVLIVIQIAVGVFQARNGLPPLAVGVHMVLAALSAATMAIVVMRLKRVPTDQ